jgi:peptidoglycan/LPS O-acetylase OafA/YrhL
MREKGTLGQSRVAERPTLKALTGLRFFAALHVVVTHTASFTQEELPPWASNIVSSGYVGVSLFFVLSGFILTYNYLDSDQTALRGSDNQFRIARVARIYPLYLVALVVAAPSLLVTVWSGHVSFSDFVLALVLAPLMLQAWSLTAALVWNAPAWSLSAEALFYALFPFMLRRAARMTERSVFLAIVASWVIALAITVGQSISASDRIWLEFVVHFPLTRVWEFCIGVLVGVGFLKFSWRVPRSAVIPIVVAILGVLTCAESVAPQGVVSNAMFVPLFCVLILALSTGEGYVARLLSTRFAVLLGEASFAIYLLHVPVWRYYLHTVDAFLPGGAESLGGVTIFIVLICIISVVAYKHIEVPGRRSLSARLTRSAAARSQSKTNDDPTLESRDSTETPNS